MAHCSVQGCHNDRCIIALCDKCYHYYCHKPYCSLFCCNSPSTCEYEQTLVAYCTFHKCKIVWCSKVKGSTSSYCVSHCCTIPGCNNLSISHDYCPDHITLCKTHTERSGYSESPFFFDDEEQYYYYEDWLL